VLCRARRNSGERRRDSVRSREKTPPSWRRAENLIVISSHGEPPRLTLIFIAASNAAKRSSFVRSTSARPLNSRQLALKVMGAKGVDTGDKVLAKAIVASRLIHALRQTELESALVSHLMPPGISSPQCKTSGLVPTIDGRESPRDKKAANAPDGLCRCRWPRAVPG
jgi:hypothetical protein